MNPSMNMHAMQQQPIGTPVETCANPMDNNLGAMGLTYASAMYPLLGSTFLYFVACSAQKNS